MSPARNVMLATAIMVGTSALAAPCLAATCANGVYRAGCAGPNGAAVVRKTPPPTTYHTYRAPTSGGGVSCANGVYRAGCAGPNGAAVVRKPY